MLQHLKNEIDHGTPARVSDQSVTLTIDVQMQFFAEEAVAKAVREADARWGGALVVHVPTGEILAWAQYPFFNPNIYRHRLNLVVH